MSVDGVTRSVFIGIEPMVKRTSEVLKLGLSVVAPRLVKWRDSGRPVPVFGPVIRPDFHIDESELPY